MADCDARSDEWAGDAGLQLRNRQDAKTPGTYGQGGQASGRSQAWLAREQARGVTGGPVVRHLNILASWRLGGFLIEIRRKASVESQVDRACEELAQALGFGGDG